MKETSQMIRELSWGADSNYFIKLMENTFMDEFNGEKNMSYSIEFMTPCIEFLCKKCETSSSTFCQCEGWNREINKLNNPTLFIGNHIQDMHYIFDNMSTQLDIISEMDRSLFIKWIEENITEVNITDIPFNILEFDIK